MKKWYNVLVEGEAYVDVEADDEREAEEKAREVLEHNPYGWDRFRTTVMGDAYLEED